MSVRALRAALQLTQPAIKSPAPTDGRDRRLWHAAALILCALFFGLQASTLNYGTAINNVETVAKYRVRTLDKAMRTLERDNILVNPSGLKETVDKWMMRFKLYSVESDDPFIIMALARIRPQELRFDPGVYFYGGAFLYPLGGWYYALTKVGAIRLGPLPQMLAHPDRMDAVWTLGRLFVLLAVTVSALIFYRTVLLVAAPGVALSCLGIYVFCPSAVIFSQMLKPHWYALLWVNLVILLLLRLFINERWSTVELLAVAVATGLAVGSVTTNGVFAVGLWVGLLLAAHRGYLRWSVPLFVVPAVAIVTFVITNPYVFLNWSNFLAERSKQLGDWFTFSLDPRNLALFVYNSVLPGLGVVAALLVICAVLFRLVQPSWRYERWVAVAIIVPAAFFAAATAEMSAWHINLRFIAFIIPVALLFLAATQIRGKGLVLGAAMVLTAAQSIPMHLAYRDENNPARSTRIQAAMWINTNIPPGTGIIVATPAPYTTPPFDFTRYPLNQPGAKYFVRVDPEPDNPIRPGFPAKLVKRFTPRLSSRIFPLVYGFINPQVSIYLRLH